MNVVDHEIRVTVKTKEKAIVKPRQFIMKEPEENTKIQQERFIKDMKGRRSSTDIYRTNTAF